MFPEIRREAAWRAAFRSQHPRLAVICRTVLVADKVCETHPQSRIPQGGAEEVGAAPPPLPLLKLGDDALYLARLTLEICLEGEWGLFAGNHSI